MSIKYVTWPVGLVKRSEVLTLASRTGVSPREAAAAWMELVETASCQESAPVLSGASLETIDRLIGLSGFAASLARVGWLTQRSDGVHIMQWDTHWCPSVAGRAASTARRREARASARQVSGQSEAKCPDKPPHTPPVCFGSFAEKERQILQTAWDVFEGHRKEKDKESWTSRSRQMSMNKVIRVAQSQGVKAAVLMMERTVESGWTGLFPPQKTELDARTSAEADMRTWLKNLNGERKDQMLETFRKTVPAKEQAREGAFMHWAYERFGGQSNG